ncbi:MAG: DUF805 domain-containing protein [Rhodoluna sp.]|nr:DUF805 domain-containing protein [Rhodoluna sp.]
MSFGTAINVFFSKYAVFAGRARRSEYWYAQLFLVLVSTAVAVVFPGEGDNNSAASNLWAIATLVPALAVGARRLHDTGRSAKNLFWLLLIFVGWIILLVYLIEDSKPGANEYGDPVK